MINLIEQRLKDLIPQEKPYHSSLYKAANYSLNTKAKRIRPLLVLYAIEALKKDVDLALDPACAIELIHTYSLIHDDLPCMDDDDLRRGKPSLHIAFPEYLAILTGDYLLTYAFEILANSNGLNDVQKIKLIQILSKRSSDKGLIAGQVVDLQSEGQLIDFKTLEFMHLNKTASLFISAMEFAAVIADVSKEDFKEMSNFGKNLGLLFQVVDDILDITLSEEKLGKPAKSDLKKNKSTTVSILGLDKAKDLAKKYYEQALKNLSKLSHEISSLEKLLSNIFNKINS